ncbi:dethiobiotin synthase [Hydrogenibacillus schlegelii]|uniref:dethiobiotin synthase n=1 Tax=Hydrogenibacillus schlegelii TaxID=1484 RepID=UPI00082717AC|nr:dethiobiotin synthase [Hydrogenibacillus schlegelii]
MSGLFVTGTDTGVGKTVFTALLVRWLRRRGVDAVPMKAVQSGAAAEDPAGDAARLLRAAGVTVPKEALVPYAFRAPLAPAVAADKAGVRVELGRILAAYQALRRRHRHVVVEGAGGLMVPIAGDILIVDLMERLGLPAVVVARSGLGTVNHTLLSLHLLRARGIPVVGVVLNDGPHGEPDPSAEDNPRLIERLGGVPVLGRLRTVPEGPKPDAPRMPSGAPPDRATEEAFGEAERTLREAEAAFDEAALAMLEAEVDLSAIVRALEGREGR